MQDERINDNDITRLIEGPHDGLDECYGQIHDVVVLELSQGGM